MSDALPPSTYAVLGLVDKVPRSSGYDLADIATRSLSYFWPLSRTLIYRELERLTGLGWVTAARVDQTQAPGKWTYRQTGTGSAALSRWLREAPVSTGTTRNPLLLRLFFSHRLPQARTLALLGEYRDALTSQLSELTAIVEKLAAVDTPGAASGRLVALHGVRTTSARLAWIDEAQALLDEERP